MNQSMSQPPQILKLPPRALDHDLLLVPRELVPAVEALVRDHRRPGEQREDGERSLYAAEDEEPEGPERRDEV